MEKQTFFGEIKGHFNLREPKGNKPTNIYFVVCIDGRQLKFSTGVKVYPKTWNKKTQTAIVSNQQTAEENRNNLIANKKIIEINNLFATFRHTLCSNPEYKENKIILLKSIIYKDMKKKKDLNTIDIIERAFDYYYKEIKPKTKESSQRQQHTNLSHFIKYIEANKLEHDTSVFSQDGINRYREYRKKDGKNVNQSLNVVCMLINDVLTIKQTDFGLKGLTPVSYIKVQDTRTKEDRQEKILLPDEVEAIKTCDLYNNRLRGVEGVISFAIVLWMACK